VDTATDTLAPATLTGWRGRIAHAVARPVARRTPFSETQIVSFLGLALLAYTAFRTARPLFMAARRA
jgi:hypothetical protein